METAYVQANESQPPPMFFIIKCHHAKGTLSFPATSLSAWFIAVWHHKQNYSLSPSNDSKILPGFATQSGPHLLPTSSDRSLFAEQSKGKLAPIATS